MTAVVIVVALVLLGLGGYVGVRIGAGLPAAGPAHAAVVNRSPSPDGPGWERTAVYVYLDRAGELLYVGVAFDPQERAEQHFDAEDEAALCSRVARIEAWWYPDRYAALAVETTLIRWFAPPFNTARGGTCDAWTERRPPITPAPVRIPRRRLGRIA